MVNSLVMILTMNDCIVPEKSIQVLDVGRCRVRSSRGAAVPVVTTASVYSFLSLLRFSECFGKSLHTKAEDI